MSSTARSYSMLDQSRKRKYEDGNCEPAAECDSDSDSDCACIAPDPDVEDSLNTLHVVEKQGTLSTSSDTGPSIKANNVGVEKHVPFSSSCDTGLSIMQAPFIKSWDTGPSIKQNAHVVEKLVAISTSCDTGPSVKQNAHVVEEPVAISTSCDTGPSVTPVPFITSSIMQGQVCVDGTSSANMTASVPSAPRPSDSSWATKYLPLHVEPQNSPTVDLDMVRGRRIWICGHSFIRRAAIRYREGELSQQAKEKDVQLHWIGEDGLCLDNIRTRISHACEVELLPFPDIVVIHLGEEEMKEGRKFLMDGLLSLFSWIRSLMPKAIILSSEVLARKNWSFGSSSRKINVSLRRLNEQMRKILTGPKIGVINHKLIRGVSMFAEDGVHLSDRGCDALLYSIFSACIQAIAEWEGK